MSEISLHIPLGLGIVVGRLAGEHVNSIASLVCGAVDPTCDGIVTGIQIKARAGDIAA